MIAPFRAALVAAVAVACTTLALLSAQAADKPFQNSDLAQSAITLEAQIKTAAGTPTKPVAQLRRDADAAFAKNDFRTGMEVLGQIVAATPSDATTWLRLARTIMQIRPANDNERALLLGRASAAAYVAYQRTNNRNEEADSLVLLGNVLTQRQVWRPALDALRLSLELREVADVRAQYERLREQHGFRVLDYTIDADTASPRACFQFSEELPARTDFSPFMALAGTDKPALSVEDKQLCVEGLQHGQTYTVTLRAGLPSVVHETLSKSSDFAIYVRDRAPSVRFSTTAYVLPRTGQNGIPVISVNSRTVAVEIYQVSDRNLIDEITGVGYGRGDFQGSLSRYDTEQLKKSRGVQVWSGELAVNAAPINQEVTTAFPVDQAIATLKPGVYVMVAQPNELKNLDNNYDLLATQWFIVSDLGLTTFSGNDGIHVFVNSLATTQAKSAVELRLVSRGNEILATRKTDSSGQALFEVGLASGVGGAAPALLAAAELGGRLCVPQPEDAGVRPYRPRRWRPARAQRARCLCVRRARCLPIRRDRLHHRTVARRAGRGGGRRAVDLRGAAARRRGVPPRRGRGSGRGRSCADLGAARLGAERHMARAGVHGPKASVGRRDDVPGRGLRT